jgi:hypothetical protein
MLQLMKTKTLSIEEATNSWRNALGDVANLFIHSQLPELNEYDSCHFLKVDRVSNNNTEIVKFDNVNDILNKHVTIEAGFKLRKLGNKLSDHQKLYYKGFCTWNLLHHYSYNGSNNYLETSLELTCNKGYLSEKIRYSRIAKNILETIQIKTFKCFAMQECEFSIYKMVVGSIDPLIFWCRFLPHRLSYDINGLYIESYGCALIIKIQLQRIPRVIAIPIEKYKHDKYIEFGYKYIAVILNNIMYSSIHFPKCSADQYIKWKEYFHYDIQNLLVNLRGDIHTGYLIGDFNVIKKDLFALMTQYKQDFTFNTIGYGVDYIVRVDRKYNLPTRPYIQLDSLKKNKNVK